MSFTTRLLLSIGVQFALLSLSLFLIGYNYRTTRDSMFEEYSKTLLSASDYQALRLSSAFTMIEKTARFSLDMIGHTVTHDDIVEVSDGAGNGCGNGSFHMEKT
jgi:hypothetical protein